MSYTASCQYIYPHLPGVTLVRELRSRNRRDFQDPHRATLQVYLSLFITNNFVTSQRLEAALQVHALDVMSHLPHSLFVRVLERFQDPGPDNYGENGEEAGAIYCDFMTVTHCDPAYFYILSRSAAMQQCLCVNSADVALLSF